MLDARFRIFRASLLAALIGLTPISNATARRAIPDDNLAYPVLISMKKGGAGSGFYLNVGSAMYLVTAKHVLFDPLTNQLRDVSLDALSYPKDLGDPKRNLITLDLSALNNTGNIKPHPSEDVVVVKIALLTPQPPKTEPLPTPDAAASQPPKTEPLPTPDAAASQPPKTEPLPTPNAAATQQIVFLPGVTAKEASTTGFLSVSLEAVKTFDQVLVGNEVMMFGYPTSLALVQNPKIDFQRPLLRKGIVAGENPPRRSIILDCPSYQGDSGGPILEIEDDSFLSKKFRVIGVMSEFVPFADTWENQHFHYLNTTLQNSGYSVVTPMDFVLDLVK